MGKNHVMDEHKGKECTFMYEAMDEVSEDVSHICESKPPLIGLLKWMCIRSFVEKIPIKRLISHWWSIKEIM